MKPILLRADFMNNLVKYWDLVYGIIIFVAAAFMIWWMFEIIGVMKEDAKRGKSQMMVWIMAAAFAFGGVYLLSDILAIFGVNVNVVK